jgi:hypothetical protein
LDAENNFPAQFPSGIINMNQTASQTHLRLGILEVEPNTDYEVVFRPEGGSWLDPILLDCQIEKQGRSKKFALPEDALSTPGELAIRATFIQQPVSILLATKIHIAAV